jgi:co-chaperonin GroES (HSP10)
MTQDQIDQLPNPRFKPNRDMVLCQRIGQSSKGIVVTLDEDKNQICRVLAVGDGLLLDCGMMRTSRYQRGDKIFVTPQDGYEIVLDGQKFWVFEAMEIIGKFEDEQDVSGYGAEHC